jgi:hypothetical protein
MFGLHVAVFDVFDDLIQLLDRIAEDAVKLAFG